MNAIVGTARATAVALALVLAGLGASGVWHAGALPDVRAELVGSMPAGAVAAGGLALPLLAPNFAGPVDPPGTVRVAHPVLLAGPRRVGLQVGHWLTQEAAPELGARILSQTGTSWNGVTEVSVNLDIAERVGAILTAQGIEVDILPTTVPVGYLADAFVAIHADGDGTGAKSGFKLAHSSRRAPYEDRLMALIADEYGAATDLDYDSGGVTRAMINYYAMAWGRYQHATSPFTPSVILELGYLSNERDRHLMVDRPGLLAEAVATGIVRFLDEHPRSRLFGADLVVPAQRARPSFAPPAR